MTNFSTNTFLQFMKRTLLYLLLFSISLISCQGSGTPNEYTGTIIELDYLNIDTIENHDWIEIDGLRFIHLSDMNEINETPWSISASNVYLNPDLMPDRSTSYTGMSIAIDLGNLLAGINKNENLTADHGITYQVLNQPLLLTHGRLRFMRSDSSKITLRVSPEYPVEVQIVE